MGILKKKVEADWHAERDARELQEAWTEYLTVLRREVANLIMASDPDLMERTYRRARIYADEVRNDAARWQAEETALTTKLRVFRDFDIIGTRHFVPYAEARKTACDDSLVERYHELCRMLTIMQRRHAGTSVQTLFDENEAEVLRKTVQRAKDASFRKRIEHAMQLYYAYKAGAESENGFKSGDISYSDAEFEVFRLPYGPSSDVDFAINFKKTGDAGVYSFFVSGPDKTYHSYYRSDHSFGNRYSLTY